VTTSRDVGLACSRVVNQADVRGLRTLSNTNRAEIGVGQRGCAGARIDTEVGENRGLRREQLRDVRCANCVLVVPAELDVVDWSPVTGHLPGGGIELWLTREPVRRQIRR